MVYSVKIISVAMNRLIKRAHLRIGIIFLLVFISACVASTVLAQDLDIGFCLRVDGENVSIAVRPEAVSTSPLKIYKDGAIYGIELVDVNDPSATKTRINLPSGIVKAIKKYVSYTVVYTWLGGAGSSLFKEVGGWYKDGSGVIHRIPYVSANNLRGQTVTATINQDIAGLRNYIKIQAVATCAGTYYWYDDSTVNSDSKNHLCTQTGNDYTWEDLPNGCHWDCNDIGYRLTITKSLDKCSP